MHHVGINVHFWGDAQQRRLLLDGIRPWAREARAEGLSDGLWYCRFDARGPHVLALFATSAARRDALHALIEARARAYLAAHPSEVHIPEAERAQRSAECRGKALCAADEEPGLADNNSLVLFDQPADRYPLWIAAGMADPGAFWAELDRVCFWALDHLEHGTGPAAALRWVAAVDRTLGRLGMPAAECWRRHAATLLPSLPARLQAGEEDAVLASVPAAVGERNLRGFAAAWEAADPPGVDPERVARMALADDGRTLQQRLRVLREINHTVLGQLGQAVRAHVPLILYAWQRNALAASVR